MIVTFPNVFCFHSPLHIISFASLFPERSSSNANLTRLDHSLKGFTISPPSVKPSFGLSVWHTRLSETWHLRIFSLPFPMNLTTCYFKSSWPTCLFPLLPIASFPFCLVNPTHLSIIQSPNQMVPPLCVFVFLLLDLVRVILSSFLLLQ